MQATKFDVAFYGNLILMVQTTQPWAIMIFGGLALFTLVLSLYENK